MTEDASDFNPNVIVSRTVSATSQNYFGADLIHNAMTYSRCVIFVFTYINIEKQKWKS